MDVGVNYSYTKHQFKLFRSASSLVLYAASDVASACHLFLSNLEGLSGSASLAQSTLSS